MTDPNHPNHPNRPSSPSRPIDPGDPGDPNRPVDRNRWEYEDYSDEPDRRTGPDASYRPDGPGIDPRSAPDGGRDPGREPGPGPEADPDADRRRRPADPNRPIGPDHPDHLVRSSPPPHPYYRELEFLNPREEHSRFVVRYGEDHRPPTAPGSSGAGRSSERGRCRSSSTG